MQVATRSIYFCKLISSGKFMETPIVLGDFF
jgi:hypothetical protein